jgi:hypothetical protein
MLLILCDNKNCKGFYFEPNVIETEDIERGNPFVEEMLRTGIEIC